VAVRAEAALKGQWRPRLHGSSMPLRNTSSDEAYSIAPMS
jgi:hypothetical protein